MALLCIYVLHEDGQYPAFGPGKELKLEWMLPILIRNLFGAWIICGFWGGFGRSSSPILPICRRATHRDGS